MFVHKNPIKFKDLDDTHKAIYQTIMDDPLVQKEARMAGVELNDIIIHDILEHAKSCIVFWIMDNVNVIKIPYLGKILVKHSKKLVDKYLVPNLKKGMPKAKAIKEFDKIFQNGQNQDI